MDMLTTSPGITMMIPAPFASTYERVCVALKAAGFEILAEIDLAAVLARQSGSYCPPHKIVVACDPEIAHRALTIAPEIDVALPCNVAVNQLQDEQIQIRIANPLMAWNVASESYLRPIAEELNRRLVRITEVIKK